MNVKIKKLNREAKLPTKHNRNDAGFDLYSIENTVLQPNQTKIIHTGISMEIEQGFYGQIKSRSSLASKGIFTTGGVIDSGYRGEIIVILNNFSSSEHIIENGDRIAQIVLQRVYQCSMTETEELDSKNDRGGGFGSSGN
ncbi:MAG: dUTP diphosphatase [Candidatus Hodarchaeales archaeon]